MKKVFVYLFILYIFFIPFSFSQDLKLTPPVTRLISVNTDNSQPGMLVKQYKYESSSSQKEIMDFYRIMFTNAGYKEIPGTKNIYYFVKQDEGKLVIINFFLYPPSGKNVYWITIQQFRLNPENE